MKRLLLSAIGLGLASAALNEATGAITFNGGGADWTFFYDSSSDTFDVVFRTKGNTDATGLTNPYAGPAGGVGGSSNDFNYSQLTMNVTDPLVVDVNGVDYFVTPASGTAYTNVADPDLGVRRRFRELDADNNVVDQFAGFAMELDWANSLVPAGSEFILFKPGDILFETANNDFDYEWSAWGHDHWHYGFSEPGTYELAFTFSGVDDNGAAVTSEGSARLTFNVVPEPSSSALVAVALSSVLLRRRRA